MSLGGSAITIPHPPFDAKVKTWSSLATWLGTTPSRKLSFKASWRVVDATVATERLDLQMSQTGLVILYGTCFLLPKIGKIGRPCQPCAPQQGLIRGQLTLLFKALRENGTRIGSMNIDHIFSESFCSLTLRWETENKNGVSYMKIAFTKDFVHHISISGLPVGKYSSRKEEQLNVHEYT